MSTLGAVSVEAGPTSIITARSADLGGADAVRRALPFRTRRTVGSWCFLDHFGPVPMASGAMAIGPHPHIGLQTVTWLLDGELLHLDSIGSRQVIRRDQLNLMTSGSGISHAEVSVVRDGAPDGNLHGLQLWLALPPGARELEPAFAHHPVLPVVEHAGWRATVVIGRCFGEESPARVHAPLLGLDLAGAGPLDVPVVATFEHGIYVVDGRLTAAAGERSPAQVVDAGQMIVFERGVERLRIDSSVPTQAFLLGGEPFPGPIHMWWNFVAGSREVLEQAVTDWNEGERFGIVLGSGLRRVLAPRPAWLSPG